jgi:hypothetical protein
MWIYTLILSTIGALAIISLSIPAKYNLLRAFPMAAAFSILLVFIGFRDRVGPDWITYNGYFESYSDVAAPDIFTTVSIEPGFTVVNYVVNRAGGDVHFVNLICALLMLAGLVRFAYLMNVDPTFLLFLATPYLLFAVGMGFTRQGAAIGLGYAALGYWVRQRPKMFYAMLALAVSFHYSAVLFFLFVRIKNWKRAMAALPIVTAFGYLLIMSVLRRYTAYISISHSNGVWFRLVIIMVGVLAVFAQRRKWESEPELSRLLINCSAIVVSLIPVAFVAATLADRLGWYLFFIYLIAFSRLPRFSEPWSRYIVLFIVYVINYIYFFLWFSISPWAAEWWIPYRNSLF